MQKPTPCLKNDVFCQPESQNRATKDSHFCSISFSLAVRSPEEKKGLDEAAQPPFGTSFLLHQNHLERLDIITSMQSVHVHAGAQI